MSSNQISLQNVGKRYNQEWIFRGISHVFQPNEHTVILGANGSGKSTLLQTILGLNTASEGEVAYTVLGVEKTPNDNLGLFSIAAPYLELIEEFTLEEALDFHQKMTPFQDGLMPDSIMEKLYLGDSKKKQIKYFSSGMKQRVKLGLALLSKTPFVLLDEPTSNLDSKAIDWYQNLVEENKKDRILVVCSNDQSAEFGFCTQQLNLANYKK